MSAPEQNPNPAERAGGVRNKPEQPRGDEPDFKTLFHAWVESHRASVVDSVGRLVKQPIGSFFTCLVMAVALSLPMGLALLLDNVERLGGSWQRPALLRAHIELHEQRNLRRPLPGVILVTPSKVDRDGLEALRQRLAELPGVEQAQLDLLWVERLTAILKLGDRFVFGLSLLLIATLLLVIGNTIRLHIENRRTEIEVVKLVGGTDGYVRRPFLYMGALYGLGAGLIAWLLLAYGLGWLNEAVVGLAGLYGSDFGLTGVPADDALSLVLGAVLLGYIGAWLAVARHLSELDPR